MKQYVITIGCEYGSGGSEIGKMLAEMLGIDFYDRDLVDKVVDELGVERDLVVDADHFNDVKYNVITNMGTRYGDLTDQVMYTQYEVIYRMAVQGPSIFIGRCADHVLKDWDYKLNFFIYAPEETRVQHVMKVKDLPYDKAKELCQLNERRLHAQYKYMTGVGRGDRHHRDLLIDSSLLGFEGTAKLLKTLVDAKIKEWDEQNPED